MAEQLKGLKLTSDERDKVRDLVEQGDNPETKKQIHELLQTMTDAEGTKRPRVDNKKIKKMATLYDTHTFWDSQPVPKADDVVTADLLDKAIDVDKTVDEIPSEPYNIPPGFYWDNVDIENETECQDVYDLLT